MFSGIVAQIGKLIEVHESADKTLRTHVVEASLEFCRDLVVGASVANNGCCLTVSHIDNQRMHFDLMQETLRKTNLGSLQAGDAVNLERAMRFGDEIGGHVMSGHITTTTTICDIQLATGQKRLTFRLPEYLKAYILEKGFIGLDGCSLTVCDVTDSTFSVYLIPETLQRTLFGTRKINDKINLEIDPQTQAIVDTVTRILNQKESRQ